MDHRTPLLRHAAVVAILLLALGATACGDDTDTIASEGTTSTAMPLEATTSVPGDAPTTAPPADAPAGCTDDTWQRLDFDGFAFALPAGMVDQEAVGIDSLVGAYEGDGMVVNFDFGWYSSDFSELDRFDPTRDDIELDGQDATLITADVGTTGGYGGRYVTAVAAEIDDGTTAEGGSTRLALWVAYDDPGQAATAACITTTVRFT